MIPMETIQKEMEEALESEELQEANNQFDDSVIGVCVGWRNNQSEYVH